MLFSYVSPGCKLCSWYVKNFLRSVTNKNVKLYGSFIWIGFNCLISTKPLPGDSLLLTTKSPGVPGTRMLELGRMEGWVDLEAT